MYNVVVFIAHGVAVAAVVAFSMSLVLGVRWCSTVSGVAVLYSATMIIMTYQYIDTLLYFEQSGMQCLAVACRGGKCTNLEL